MNLDILLHKSIDY